MRWLSMLRLRLRSLFRRAQVEQELEDELRFHVDQLTARHVERGLPVDDARRTALRTTYGIEAVKDRSRDVRRVGWIEDCLRDARYALRALRQKPTFAAMAMVSLAVGIAAATGLFSIVNAALLHPFPFADISRLVTLEMIGRCQEVSPVCASVTNRSQRGPRSLEIWLRGHETVNTDSSR